MGNSLRHCLAIGALAATLLAPPPAGAQSNAPFRAEYTVEVKDTTSHLFHVTATFSNLAQPQLDVALPIWTPGWYTLEYYAKNVRRFVVTDGAGTRLAAPLSRAQTWTIDTRGKARVVVEFDYVADVLALNQAKITGTYAFFTGTQLFLEPVGHRNAPSLVRFVVPPGWRIVSALAQASGPAVYTAPDYDALVDAPTWLGAFESEQFEVDGKPHFFVIGSGMDFPADSMRRHTERLAAVVRTAAAIFGGLPYDKYLFFNLPDTAESDAAGALEHGNSFVGCCGGPIELMVSSYTAHEFFHLWNVKRIRPAELWPYDYSRPVETPSLWVSEGVSDYYGGLIAYRAGFLTDTAFIGGLAATMEANARNGERQYLSPSDASMATWRAYLREPVSYYATGAILGALLDLSLLHDTQGRRGLDDVMRVLYHEFFQQNRGFTPRDLVRAVSSVGGRDYTDFFRRYVTGFEAPPFDSILDYAGVRTVPSTQVRSNLQAASTPVAEGRRIDLLFRGGAAATAGLQKGDVLVAIDDIPIGRIRFLYPNGCCWLTQRDHQRIVVTILRDSSRMQIPVTLRPGPSADANIAYDSTATVGQLAVRRAWLARRE
ncbi:MAG: hypothetical protein Q8N53_23725 [Longimicrobiales bacterium]|nr:hypothetical protein [Longimicrobiales bacterium]